ncbi:hypothetical protein MXD81_42945 [Microbacteriaceae bacterium K1510]|nr:hypothetical protein [Microbacteriaceae bacterium K1510]
MSRSPAFAALIGRLPPVFALIATLLAPAAAWAQQSGDSLLSSAPSTGLLSPGSATRGEVFGPGGVLSAPAQGTLTLPNSMAPTAAPMVPAGQVALALSAKFGKDQPPITGGLTWRVYAAKATPGGDFRLVKQENAPAPTLVLPPGSYIVHVGFGLATLVKPVTLRGATVHEEFELPAGGLRLEGRVGDVRIPAGQISFDVYRGSQFEPGDRRPIAEHVMTGSVVVVPEGTYYIVSNYGDANSVIRSDIRVQAGKLTDITVTHRAAAITLKLVSDKGGEALANTAWSVLTPGGDVIKESIGAFPRVILAEGEYRAIARNEGKVYEREFKVVTGVDGDIEVMAR